MEQFQTLVQMQLQATRTLFEYNVGFMRSMLDEYEKSVKRLGK